MSKVFNIPQFEEQFSPVRVEGESSQENLPNQEADEDQVDLSITVTMASTVSILIKFSSRVAEFAAVWLNNMMLT